MAVSPNDFSLTPQQLRARYTVSELEETKRLLETFGESRYRNDFVNITAKDPGKMDMFSSEYGAELASNIVPSFVTTLTGIADMIFNPIDTAEALYDLGLDGTVDALKDQYGSWESIKRTIATDPFGQATVVAPGFGAMGRLQSVQKAGAMARRGVGGALEGLSPKVGSVVRPAAGLAADVTRNVGQPIVDMVMDPVGAVGSVAVKGTASLMRGTGILGRIALEFITGEPVQSLEAMQRAGRLTDSQMDIAGLNPLHWLGRFDDPDLKRQFGETPTEHFRRARSTDPDIAGGFRDEAATVGHISAINQQYANIILQEADGLMEKIFRGWLDGDTFSDIRSKGYFGGAKGGGAIQGTATTIPLIADSMAFQTNFVSKLNTKLKSAGVGIKFKHDRETGKVDYIPVDTGVYIPGSEARQLITWIRDQINGDLTQLPNMKKALIGDSLTDTPGVIQQLLAHRYRPGNAPTLDAFYDTLRDSLDELTTTLDTGRQYSINDLLPKSGSLRELLDDPMSQDNMWARIIRHENIREDLARTYSAFKESGTGDSDILKSYIKALQSDPIKKQLIDEVEKVTGESIHAGIAGLISRRWTPSSLVARGSAVSALQRTVAVGAAGAAFNPLFFMFIPFSSPRFTGKILQTIGLGQRAADYGKALTRHMLNHPVGKVLGDQKRTIWSVGTVLEQIQRYNAQHAPQASVGLQQEENR